MGYTFASDAELQTMLSWVTPREDGQTLEEFELTDAQRKEIRAMFALYDKDRSGTIEQAEFRQAMRRCGLDAEETADIFAEADLDGDGHIDFEEFTALMRQTLFNGTDLTFEMLYSPI